MMWGIVPGKRCQTSRVETKMLQTEDSSMTETVTCARCHGSFERVRLETEEVADHTSHSMMIEETEPICEECEHQFLAWTCCPPIV
jgi:hypothetical protein